MLNPHFTVFVSYSSKDYPVVHKVVEFLRNSEVSIWFDDLSIIPGTTIMDRIHEGLSSSQILILFISKNSIKSKWVNYEWNSFIDRSLRTRNDIYLIPIVLDEVKLPDAIARFRYLKFQPDTEFFSKLSEAIKNLVIEDAEKKWGFRVLYSEQTERIVNKRTSVLTQRTIVKPLGNQFRKYVFSHWQNEKSKIDLIRTEVLDQQTGSVIPYNLKELKNDENSLEVECKLVGRSREQPLIFIFEIKTENYFPNLFKTGVGYSEFLVRLPVERFVYNLITPNKIPYKNIEVFTSHKGRNKKLTRKERGAEILFSYGPKYLTLGEPLKFTINNNDF